MELIRSWPATSVAHATTEDDDPAVSVIPTPTFPLKARARVESHFGLVPGEAGGHTILSTETRKYPHFAALLSRWTTQFSQEWLRDSLSFTTVSILKTQDAQFTSTDDTTGVVMLVDVSKKTTGGFYVLDTRTESVVHIHSSETGPLLLASRKQHYLPRVYSDDKTIIRLSTVKQYQSTPRPIMDSAMSLGYACSRYTGQVFQGLTEDGVESF